MNLLDATITELVGEPKEVPYRSNGTLHSWWKQRVKYNCGGVPGETSMVADTEEEINQVHVGQEIKV